MRTLIIELTYLCLAACSSSHRNNPEALSDSTQASSDSVALNSDTIQPASEKVVRPDIQYTDQQLESFLDSVGHLSSSVGLKNVSKFPDSIFLNRQQIDRTINKDDFEKLKRFSKEGKMDFAFAKTIFKDIDSTYLSMDSLPISFLSFDKKSNDFNEFAIAPGVINGLSWGSDVYFFASNRIIAKHSIQHRYGLELSHYKDADGKTIIYYKENYQSGSGIWWFNFYFYKYYDNKLIPILNELENANLQLHWHIRVQWLESRVEKTSPLTIKMVYYVQLADSLNNYHFLINDSTKVRYTWDEESRSLKGDYIHSKIRKEQILSYYLDANELLFINSYYKTLKRSLDRSNRNKRQATLIYLNSVRNHFDGSNADR